MTSNYQVAIIGCGARAREHIPAILADDRCRLAALCDVRLSSAEQLNKELGLDAALYSDHMTLLDGIRPDIVILCLWTELHLPVFRDCAKKGARAVISEKPMAATYGDSLEMARIAEDTGCQLTFSHQRRFASGNLAIRQWLREGRIGDITRLELYSPPNLLDCGTHTIDQALSFMDECPAQWVLGAVDASETHNWFNVPSESVAVGLIVFENGVRAHLQAGGPDMDIWGGVRVTGTQGFVEVYWDGEIRRAVVYSDPQWLPEQPKSVRGEQMTGLFRDALNALQSGQEAQTSHRKALRAAEIIFAFYESVRRHARVGLPLAGVTDNPFAEMLRSGELQRYLGKGE